jgi:enoyl-CoA hydratase
VTVRLEDRDAIRIVTIDNVDHSNALDVETFEGLGNAFTGAAEDARVRVLILTGAGTRSFCAGMDLKAFAAGGQTRLGPGPRVFTEQFFPKPIVAAVNGTAVGGGLGLVLGCDIVIAAEHARFGIPEAQRGLVGTGVISRIASRLGPGPALELALSGDLIGVDRAFALGLVHRVVAQPDLLSTAIAWAERIAANAPLAVAATKRVILEVAGVHDYDLATLRAQTAHVSASADAKEGARAFLERRQPVFRGE